MKIVWLLTKFSDTSSLDSFIVVTNLLTSILCVRETISTENDTMPVEMYAKSGKVMVCLYESLFCSDDSLFLDVHMYWTFRVK